MNSLQNKDDIKMTQRKNPTKMQAATSQAKLSSAGKTQVAKHKQGLVGGDRINKH